MFFFLKKKNEGTKTLTSLVLLRTAQATNDFLVLVQMKTRFRFRNLMMLQKQLKKRLLKHTEHWE